MDFSLFLTAVCNFGSDGFHFIHPKLMKLSRQVLPHLWFGYLDLANHVNDTTLSLLSSPCLEAVDFDQAGWLLTNRLASIKLGGLDHTHDYEPDIQHEAQSIDLLGTININGLAPVLIPPSSLPRNWIPFSDDIVPSPPHWDPFSWMVLLPVFLQGKIISAC